MAIVMITLGEIMPPAAGLVDPSKFPDEIFDLYSIPAFDRSRPEVVAGRAIGSAKQVVEPGDVLLSKIVPHIRRSWVVGERRGRRMIASGEWMVFRHRGVYPNYIRHVLVSDYFHRHLMRTVSGVGGSLLRARPALVAKIQVPLPPFNEQQRIAEMLDRAEALRAKRRAALAQLDALAQAVFIDLFGNPVTNPRNWPKATFGELGENQDYLRVPVRSADRDSRRGPYPYYGASGIIDWVDEYIFDGERLLIGEDGANLVARVTPVAYMARGKYWVNNHAHVIATNGRASLRYLEFLIEGLDLRPFISGTAQPKLTRGNLDRILVPVPPLKLQHRFDRLILSIERMKELQRASLANLDALFASLLHRAFRGEL